MTGRASLGDPFFEFVAPPADGIAEPDWGGKLSSAKKPPEGSLGDIEQVGNFGRREKERRAAFCIVGKRMYHRTHGIHDRVAPLPELDRNGKDRR